MIDYNLLVNIKNDPSQWECASHPARGRSPWPHRGWRLCRGPRPWASCPPADPSRSRLPVANQNHAGQKPQPVHAAQE